MRTTNFSDCYSLARRLALAIGLALVLAAFPTLGADKKHVVKKTETLTDIAANYGVPVETLIKANGLKKPDQIRAGQTLVIPSAPAAAASAPASATDQSLQKTIVKKNETLSDIARQYGVTIQLLAACNELDKPDQIRAGQTLLIPPASAAKPVPAAEPIPPKAGQKVTVQKNETLSDIAARYGVTIDLLARHNGLAKPDQIHAGQTLIIPGERTPSRAPALDPALKKDLDKAPVKRSRWKYVVIHHSATDVGTVKGMDAYHREHRNMENGLAYHFVIGNGNGMRDGEIAIGHRWTRQLDGGHLHSAALNQESLGICLVGNFDHARPTAKQVESLRALVAYLLDRCKLKPAAVQTHQQINPVHTRCPGQHFALVTVLGDLKPKKVADAAR